MLATIQGYAQIMPRVLLCASSLPNTCNQREVLVVVEYMHMTQECIQVHILISNDAMCTDTCSKWTCYVTKHYMGSKQATSA